MTSSVTLPTDACTISSFNEAVKKAEALRINITTLASECPQLCDVAYGSGNPDLSGVGVNASYLTFVGLAILFSLLRIGTLWSTPGWTKFMRVEHMQAIQRTFADMSGVFSSSVGVAFIISSQRQLSLYESIFVGDLCFILWLATVLAISVSLFRDGIKDLKDITPKLLVMSLIHFWGITAILLFMLAETSTSHSYSAPAQQLSFSCKPYKDAGLATSDSRWKVRIILIVLGFLSIVVTLCFFLLGYLKYRSTRQNLPQLGDRQLRVLKVILTIILCIFSLLTVAFTVESQLKRNAMRRVAGTRFQDDTWGFGQVIAIFVWVPLLPVLWWDK